MLTLQVPTPNYMKEFDKKDKRNVLKYEDSSEALNAAGAFGRYQIYTCIILQYSAVLGTGISALGSFGQLLPEYKCDDANHTILKYTPEDVEKYQQECSILKCENYSVNADSSFGFHSMAAEWLLICDENRHLRLILFLGALGRTLGMILGGHIGDYWGRKKALYPSQYGICLVSTLSTACTQWESFAGFFFFIGLLYGIGEATSFVLVVEKTDRAHRWIVNSCFQWSITYPVVALIAYLTGSWRLYLIMINVLLAPLLVFYLIFLESPRWLIYHGELDRAAKTLSDIASDRWNQKGITMEPEDLNRIPTRLAPPPDPKYPTPLELFRSWPRARLTLTLMFAMLIRSILVNIYIQDGSLKSGSPFTNIALYGITRIWIPFFIVFIDWKVPSFGRRACFLLFYTAILLISIAVTVLEYLDLLHGTIKQFLGLAGSSLCASGGWLSLSMVMVEAYPTAIRGIAYGWIEAVDGVGGLLGPPVLSLTQHLGYIPVLVFSIMCLFALVSGYLVIPETKLEKMNDGIHQVITSRLPSRSPSVMSLSMTQIH